MSIPTPHSAATPQLCATAGRSRPTRMAALVAVAAGLVALATIAAPRFVEATQGVGGAPGTQSETAQLALPSAAMPSVPSQTAQNDISSLPLTAQAAISGVLGRDNRDYHATATAQWLPQREPRPRPRHRLRPRTE